MTTSTINTIPNAGSADFNSVLQNFLREEDAERAFSIFGSFTVSGGIHATIAGLVGTPSSLLAYPGGFYITETGSITYADNKTNIWVFAHKDTTTAIGGNFVRVAGTHYIIESVSVTQPTTPLDSTPLMHVTTSAGAITIVVDIREFITTLSGPAGVSSAPIRLEIDDYTPIISDGTILVDATAKAIDITLPTAVEFDEHIYHIKKIDSSANNVTLVGTIDEGVNAVISVQYSAISVHFDRTEWWII